MPCVTWTSASELTLGNYGVGTRTLLSLSHHPPQGQGSPCVCGPGQLAKLRVSSCPSRPE